MKRIAIGFLRIGLVLVGVGASAFLVCEPWVEGRNANATWVDVYFRDPFLAYVYLAAVPFFMGLHQALKVLGHVERGLTFSRESVRAVRTIRLCAMAILGFVAVSLIFIGWGDPEDRPQGMVMRLLVAVPAVVMAAAAMRFERAARTKLGTGAEVC